MVLTPMFGSDRTAMETPSDMFSSAPDVSPDDVWADAACLAPEGEGLILPPKRAKQDKPGGLAHSADDEGGLRIGTRISTHSSARDSPKIEVQEILGTVVRLQPDLNETERMPRHLVFHEKSSDRDEFAISGEAREWGRSKKQPVFMILGIGVAISALVTGAIIALPFVNKPNVARPGSGESDLVVEKIAEGEAMAEMLSRKEEASRTFHAILSAPSIEAMLPHMRNAGEVASLIRTDRRMPQLDPNSRLLKTDAWKVRENQSLTFGILSGTLPDYSKYEAYFVVSEGRLAMDWKASTAHGTADFSQLMRKLGDPAEIRGWIEAADYYTFAFPENSYQAYQLASPDKEKVIWAYARWGSEIHRKLKNLIKGGYILQGRKEAQKVTVRLGPGPGHSLPGQWEIVELLHKEWIAP
jgi:hypothetical protein